MRTLKSIQADFFVLNWIRGICAILVVLGHSRNFYPLRDYSRGGDISGWNSILLIPTSLAMESVAIFFLISGFLVGGQVWRNVSTSNFHWNRFLVDRFTRLWVVLIPGLVLSELVRNLIARNGKFFSTSSDSLLTFSCNLLFLMPTRCEPFASNESLWSLGYEFYFYLIFAFLALLLSKGSSMMSRFFNIVGLCSVILIFTSALLPLFFAWLCGFFIYLLSKMKNSLNNGTRSGIYWILALVSLGVGMLLTNTVNHSEVMVILLIAIFGFFPVLLSTRYTQDAGKSSRGMRSYLDFFGKASFTIYVFHLPLIQLFYSLLGQIDQDYDVIVIYSISLLSILTSAGFYFLFEQHTHRARRLGYRILRISL